MLQRIENLELQVDPAVAMDSANRKLTEHCIGNHGCESVVLPETGHQTSRWRSRDSLEKHMTAADHEGFTDEQVYDDDAPFVVVLVHGDVSMVRSYLRCWQCLLTKDY